MNKKPAVFITTFLFGIASVLFGQDRDIQYSFKNVTEFENIFTKGFLFYNVNASGETSSGNRIVFDEKGTLIVHQLDQALVYFFDPEYKRAQQQLVLSRPIAGLSDAQEDRLYFTVGDDVTCIKYNDEIVFKVNPYQIVRSIRFTSFCYYADILFFLDDKYRLHSILHPGLDQKKNRENYRNPEQTSKLFEADAEIDLKGLTQDIAGNLFINKKFISNGKKFYPVLNELMYIQGMNKFWVSSNERDVATISIPRDSNETLESTALHPSGDIYFLRFNKVKNKHILYRIENTWDSETKKAWESRKK